MLMIYLEKMSNNNGTLDMRMNDWLDLQEAVNEPIEIML